MPQTLDFKAPAFSPRAEEQPRVRSVQFGDGYEGRYGDGLNTRLAKVSVPWRALTQNEADALLYFLRDHKGRNWFFWKLPGEPVARKWVARGWSWARTDGTGPTAPRYDIDVQLDEVADLFG